MRETYIGGFTGKRKVFYYFTLIIGMVFLRVFDLYFIIISYFILVIFNTVVILFGSRKDSSIWNFYVNQLGYNKVVQIVGNPLSLLAKLGGKALLPKAGTVVKPLVKVGGGLIVFDVVVGDHFGLYNFTNARAYDLNHLCVTKLMSQNVPYDPPVWGNSKSIIRVICESSEGKELALDTIKKDVK
jgi:hypothetical protein